MPTSSAILAVHQLNFSFQPGESVLTDVSFSLAAGEKILLQGDNGSGKSTLLHLITGLLRPQSGSIFFAGQPCLTEQDMAQLRRHTGYLLQNSDEQLFNETVLEDVAFAPLNFGVAVEEARQLALECLELCGVAHLAHKSVYALSGGEKKMVALAGILAQQPDILLLDEASNTLDTRMHKHMTAIIRELPQSMLIISHDTAFATSICTNTWYLHQGRLSTKS